MPENTLCKRKIFRAYSLALDLPTHILTLQRKISASRHNLIALYQTKRLQSANLTDGTMTLKEVAACFLVVSEYGWSEQLCGVGTVPFLEVSLVEPNVVHNIGKPSGTE